MLFYNLIIYSSIFIILYFNYIFNYFFLIIILFRMFVQSPTFILTRTHDLDMTML